VCCACTVRNRTSLCSLIWALILYIGLVRSARTSLVSNRQTRTRVGTLATTTVTVIWSSEIIHEPLTRNDNTHVVYRTGRGTRERVDRVRIVRTTVDGQANEKRSPGNVTSVRTIHGDRRHVVRENRTTARVTPCAVYVYT